MIFFIWRMPNDASALIFILRYFLLKLFTTNLEEEVDWILELGPAKRKSVFNQSSLYSCSWSSLSHWWRIQPEYDDVENVSNNPKSRNERDGQSIHKHHHELLGKERILIFLRIQMNSSSMMMYTNKGSREIIQSNQISYSSSKI